MMCLSCKRFVTSLLYGLILFMPLFMDDKSIFIEFYRKLITKLQWYGRDLWVAVVVILVTFIISASTGVKYD